MTKFEFKDLLIEKSLEGSFPCIDSRNHCLYRQGNKRCVIGWSIPDNEYRKEFEYSSITNLEDYGYDPYKNVENATHLELVELQRYHDSLSIVKEEWNHEEFVRFLNKLWPEN